VFYKWINPFCPVFGSVSPAARRRGTKTLVQVPRLRRFASSTKLATGGIEITLWKESRSLTNGQLLLGFKGRN
jgi:hypothetical protein